MLTSQQFSDLQDEITRNLNRLLKVTPLAIVNEGLIFQLVFKDGQRAVSDPKEANLILGWVYLQQFGHTPNDSEENVRKKGEAITQWVYEGLQDYVYAVVHQAIAPKVGENVETLIKERDKQGALH